jgi:AcrR family transcriptional regulator
MKSKRLKPSAAAIPDGAVQTRSCLMDAAKRLFARKGFDATSVKTLAEEAGVNVSLVSYHFGGKEGLYKACLSQFTEKNLATAKRVLQPVSSGAEFRIRLRMFMEEVFEGFISEPELMRILHRDIELSMPHTMEVFGSTIMKMAETLVDFIKRAQAAGVIRKDVDPLTCVGFLMGVAQHFMRIDHISKKFFNRSIRDKAHREVVLDHYFKLFLEGLESRPGTQKA